MRYVPILEELFSSDSILFLILGIALALLLGARMGSPRSRRFGVLGSLLVYVCCELISNLHTSYLLSLVLLILGTAALGALLGFGISAIAAKPKNE